MSIINELRNKKQYIIDEYTNGKTVNQLAEEFSCDFTYLYRFMKQNNICTKQKQHDDGFLINKFDEIKQLFDNGLPMFKIAKKLGCSRTAVTKILKDNGIDTEKFFKNKKRDFVKNYKNEILNLYLNEKRSVKYISKKFNFDHRSVARFLIKSGIEIRKRKYFADFSYFKKIDTQEKAYILGLIYTDGCVKWVKNKDKCFVISMTDLDIIQKVKKAINYTGPIYFKKRRKPHYKDQYAICVHSKEMAQDLINLGCVPRKTHVLRFPYDNEVPNYLLNHFLRGCIDGDGSIHKNTRCNSAYLSLVSTKAFITIFDDIIKELFCVSGGIYKQKPNKPQRIWILTGIEKILPILNWLYQDSTIHLDRKYRLYLKIKEKALISA